MTETFLVLRLEEASRYVGLPLLDPAYPQLAPVAWHERTDPGAELLSWITRSHALAPTRRPAPGTLECEAEPVGADEVATAGEAESFRDGPLTTTCRDH